MREDFNDEFISEHVDPLQSTQDQDFDWPGLYRAFGEAEGEQEHDLEKIVWTLKQILAWLVTAPIDSHGVEIIGRRALALAWVVSPEYLGGKSLSAVARKLGVSTATLSKHSAAFSRRFKVSNRGQAHAWNMGGFADPSGTFRRARRRT